MSTEPEARIRAYAEGLDAGLTRALIMVQLRKSECRSPLKRRMFAELERAIRDEKTKARLES